MAYTHEQLDAIESAIARGTTRVKYKDREIQYASLADLMSIRNLIRQELGAARRKQLPAEYDNDL